ncbi:MAG TPA: FGGY family carbohydrate kinase, partial [Arachnia sp.]|nr:FGGY family carbohydrate kinase [Arachnia sp.]
MTLVAGVDTSTQSCKVLVVDAGTGEIVRQGAASHPDGSEVHPDHWWTAFQSASAAAGGLDDVAAISVGGQQHGMVALDASGEVIRPALLWNDTRSAEAARQLREEFDGWVPAVGYLPLASFTNTKLRWMADAEPDNAARVAAVALPHDWLTWKIQGSGVLSDLVTDRSDASGTGYFDSVRNEYRRDLLSLALRRDASSVVLPRVLAPDEGVDGGRWMLGPGCGDNAGAALGLDLRPGQTSVSLGTSGVVAAVSSTPAYAESGLVNGFADASGSWLPLTATLNAARILDAARRVLGVDFDELSRL